MSLKKIACSLALLVSFSPLFSLADGEKKLQKTSETSQSVNPWTECGIGAMIFNENKALAAISNIVWDFGTTAVISSGLSKNTCEGRQVVAAAFISQNYALLEEETALGKGEHVATVLDLMGCQAGQHDVAMKSLRAAFATDLSSDSYLKQSAIEKAQGYYKLANQVCSV